MNVKKNLAIGIFCTMLFQSVSAYDVVARYKLIDDKLKTDAMMRPYGHDFLFDVSATVNKNITSFIDDVEKSTKAGTLASANEVLTKYDKTEQTLKVNVALGIPLFSFSAFDFKIVPNIRALLDVGANIGIRSQLLTVADVVNYFPEEVPTDLKTFVLTLTPGTDVITACNASSTLSATTKAFCATQKVGQYIIPSTTQTVPTIAVFGKADAKVGFFNDYSYGEHFFGQFNLYGLGRADLFQIITAEQIAKGQNIEAPKKMNTEVTTQLDYRLGYKNTNYSAFLGVEELKLAKMKDASADAKAQSYGYQSLIRAQADALYNFSAFSLQPFLGVHKRSGYAFGDGVYAGATAGAHVFGDRLGLQLRGMVDKQYFTISPRLKLWLMQIEYTLKNPVKSTDGDVNLTALHTLDFRLFF
jgi:hypothetical protein